MGFPRCSMMEVLHSGADQFTPLDPFDGLFFLFFSFNSNSFRLRACNCVHHVSDCVTIGFAACGRWVAHDYETCGAETVCLNGGCEAEELEGECGAIGIGLCGGVLL